MSVFGKGGGLLSADHLSGNVLSDIADLLRSSGALDECGGKREQRVAGLETIYRGTHVRHVLRRVDRTDVRLRVVQRLQATFHLPSSLSSSRID